MAPRPEAPNRATQQVWHEITAEVHHSRGAWHQGPWALHPPKSVLTNLLIIPISGTSKHRAERCHPPKLVLANLPIIPNRATQEFWHEITAKVHGTETHGRQNGMRFSPVGWQKIAGGKPAPPPEHTTHVRISP